MQMPRKIFIPFYLTALLAVSLMQTTGVQTQNRAPQDQSWNRRVDGAGEYQNVLEVSGRVEITRAFKMPDALDLKSICQAKQDAERRTFLSAEGYLSALENSVEASRQQIEIIWLHNELGQLWSYRGEMANAIKHFESVRAAKDDTSNVRQAAVLELARGWKDDPDTLTILKDRAVNDATPEAEWEDWRSGVRDVALQAITRGWPDDPDTLVLLRERAKNDPTRWLREKAKELADRIEARNSGGN